MQEECLVCVETSYNDAGLPPVHGCGYVVYHIPMKSASLTNKKRITQLLVHMFPVLLCSLLYTKYANHPSLSHIPSSLWQRVHTAVALNLYTSTINPLRT